MRYYDLYCIDVYKDFSVFTIDQVYTAVPTLKGIIMPEWRFGICLFTLSEYISHLGYPNSSLHILYFTFIDL